MYKSLLARRGGFWGAESLSFVSKRLQVERVSSYLVVFFFYFYLINRSWIMSDGL